MTATKRSTALLGRLRGGTGVRSYSLQSRRFHLARVAPSRIHPLLFKLGSAWNVREPFQPMALVSGEHRRHLHAEQGGMLARLLDRDAAALLLGAGRRLDQLAFSIAGLPVHTGLFTDGATDPSAPGRGGC